MSSINHNGRVANGHRIARPAANHPNLDHWYALRRAALERDLFAWRTCWRDEADGFALKCHHRHYDTWGHERLEDVVMLCVPCHDLHTNDVRLARYAQIARSAPTHVPWILK